MNKIHTLVLVFFLFFSSSIFAQSKIDSLLNERKVYFRSITNHMDLSVEDSLILNNILNYNFESDKLIIEEYEKLDSLEKELFINFNKLTDDNLSLMGKMNEYEKYLIIASGTAILFILMFIIFLSLYLSFRKKLDIAEVDIKQANENYSNTSEEKHKNEKVFKQENLKLSELNKELQINYNLQRETIKYLDDEIELNKENITELNKKLENLRVRAEEKMLPESRKKMDELEINLLKIEKLSRLKDIGALTPEEYDAIKNKIVNEM